MEVARERALAGGRAPRDAASPRCHPARGSAMIDSAIGGAGRPDRREFQAVRAALHPASRCGPCPRR